MIHKTTRSILSVLLAALLLVTSIPLTPAFADGGAVSPQSASGEGSFAGGTGAANDPYQIATADDLREFAKLVNEDGETTANAILTDDIDLNPGFTFKEDGSYSGPGGEEPHQWTPIGTSSNNPYRGTFNGNGKTISGLYINRSDSDQGLFGYVSGTVQNLSVSGSVSGHLYVGGIAGQNNGNVINCAFSGTVSGISYAGGVVGYNGASVKNCYNTGAVSGSGLYVGGVVGLNGGSVENCYNTGTVNGSAASSNVGGVVGQNFGGTVKNCYNTGSVTGTDDYVGDVGGVVGYNNNGTVENCYNTGAVSGSGLYVGGVVGYNFIGGSVTGCYFLQQDGLSGGATGAESLTADEFAIQNSFTNSSWDFDNTWKIESIFGRPTLRDNAEIGGTANNPYKIFTATQLAAFRDLVNGEGEKSAHAKLMNDINLKDVCGPTLDSGQPVSWTPIGNIIDEEAPDSFGYTGTFNGDGHTISGLYIAGDDNDQGLFGYLDQGGIVQNLTVSGTVSGGWYVGGVVGRNDGTVKNCYNTGAVSGSGWCVGGVVGKNNGGTVENCYNTGAVNSSGNRVGGVVGDNGGTVKNCYNTDAVNSSGDRVGGVVGRNDGTVKNCYNIGTVSGSNYVGGVVGWNDSGANVENCYNTGAVSGGNYVGGVVGYNSGFGSSAFVENCYFLQTADVNVGRPGIGGGSGTSSNVEARTAAAFHSGEVAWRLQNGQTAAGEEDPIPQVWGQSNLTATTSLPTLVALDKANAQKVYQVTFDYGTSFADNDGRYAYSYTNGVVSKPDKNPELAGHTLSGWYSDPSLTTAWNFSTAVTENMILYAQWTAIEEPEPEPEEPPYSGKYSYEVSTSVGDHGSLSVDRYATEGEKVTISVSPDEAYKLDDLTVTAHGKEVELTANSDGTYSFTMPSADVKISATFAEDPDWTEPEEPTTDVSDIFVDIAPDAWYKDAVQYAYDNGLMTGVSATEFAPEQTTTRAMIVSILARLEGVTTAQAAGFADVDDNDWYATAVNWAANVGVVNGYEDNTFQPNTAITREQLAAILMNYAAYKGEDVSNRADLTSYTDQPSTWAEEAMQWAVAEGLISGVTNTELQPQSSATRAQVAAILQRFLEA